MDERGSGEISSRERLRNSSGVQRHVKSKTKGQNGKCSVAALCTWAGASSVLVQNNDLILCKSKSHNGECGGGGSGGGGALSGMAKEWRFDSEFGVRACLRKNKNSVHPAHGKGKFVNFGWNLWVC